MAHLEHLSRCCLGALACTSKKFRHSAGEARGNPISLLLYDTTLSVIILNFIDKIHPPPTPCGSCPRTMIGDEAKRCIQHFIQFYASAMDFPLCERCDPPAGTWVEEIESLSSEPPSPVA